MKNRHNVRTIFLLLILNSLQPLLGQAFRQLSYQDGLSNDKVTAITTDSKGICWIGTTQGLNRFVEGEITHYKVGDRAAQRVHDLFIDAHSQLWAAVDDYLYRYNQELNTFENIMYEGRKFPFRSRAFVEEGIVICTPDGIFLYDYTNQALNPLKVGRISNMSIRMLTPINAHQVLAMCLNYEFYLIDMPTRSTKKYENIAFDDFERGLVELFVDSDERLWVSPYNRGLYRFNLENGGKLERWFSSSNSDLAHGIILDIKEHEGKIVATTDGGGIQTIDMATDEIKMLYDSHNLALNNLTMSTTCIYTNIQHGQIWLGTVRNGAVNIPDGCITSYDLRTIDRAWSNGLTSQAIQCLIEDDRSQILLGTDGDGVIKYAPQRNEFSQIKSTANEKIIDLGIIDSDWMLLSIYDKGLVKVNRRTGRRVPMIIGDKKTNEQIITSGQTINLARLDKNGFCLLSNELCYYDFTTKQTRVLTTNFESKGKYKLANRNNKHTVVYNLNSVCEIVNATQQVNLLFTSPDQTIVSVSANDNTIVVNYGDRVDFVDRRTGAMHKMKAILSNTVLKAEILSTIIGKNDHVWLFTNHYLICIDSSEPEKQVIFDQTDGLSSNRFLPNVTLMSSWGNIYAAGNDGFVSIGRNLQQHTDSTHTISLTELECNNEEVRLNEREELSIPWNYTSLSLRFYVDNSDSFKKHTYRYLIDHNGNKRYTYSNNQLSLPALAPGKYVITPSYFNNNGMWVESVHPILLTVTPPWWRTMWFTALLILFFMSMVAAILFWYYQGKKRKMTQNLLEKEQKLTANKVKFLINLAHELRTPLTLIHAPIKQLMRHSELSSELKSDVAGIYAQSRYMKNLINTVLELRKLEVGYGEVLIGTHHFNDWVCDTAAEFRTEFEAHQIEMQLDLDKAITTVNFDQEKCRIVLTNLLMNCCKYSNPNTVARIETKLTGGRVRLSIVDQGVGLEGVNIEGLFDRFVQVHDKSKGTGIGLSYSKVLIDLHPGATISAYSNPDCGATFYFELPMNIEATTLACEPKSYLDTMFAEPMDPNTHEILDFSLGNSTVLIVEDKPELLAFLKSNLEKHFKEVLTAENGEVAYKKAEKKYPDIIISDVMMPKMNGYQLCSAVKNNMKISHVPVILLTAKADTESKIVGYKSGADAYIPKPFDMDELLYATRNLLHTREKAKSLYSSNIIDPVSTSSNVDEQFLIKLNAYILEHIASEELSAQMIVEQMNMSRASFYNKMKALTGIGIMEYVTNIKLSVAKELLTTSNDPICDIAASVGYLDSKYFGKIFKQNIGVSPRDYRKLHSNEKEADKQVK